MENRIYRLTKPGVIRVDSGSSVVPRGAVVIRPVYLSICAADQRYWSGRRNPGAMRDKLPVALVHEAVGKVVDDDSDTFEKGTPVVMIPIIPSANEKDTAAKEQYAGASRFASSDTDGFMRDYVIMSPERLIPCNEIEPQTAVMTEIVSVCISTYDNFEAVNHVRPCDTIGIWGDGPVGFLLAALIAKLSPNTKIVVFGTHDNKLERFDFVHATHNIRKDFKTNYPIVDHAFECTGGTYGCTNAIDQILNCIAPQGVISLMGVSEQNIPINTRMILEKGLTIQGNRRSSRKDFERALELLQDELFAQRVTSVIEHVIPVQNVEDMKRAFRYDELHPYKTIMQWDV